MMRKLTPSIVVLAAVGAAAGGALAAPGDVLPTDSAEIQAMLESLPIKHLWLRHQSAYDEMVGQVVRTSSNHLQVKLSRPNKPGELESPTSIKQNKIH